MSYKSATQPLCRYCGAKIAKRTRIIYFGATVLRSDNISSQRAEKPRSKAEVQRLTNQVVTAIRWSAKWNDSDIKERGDTIYSAHTWDGESYVDKFFCNGEHARAMGYLAASHGTCTKDYNAAVAAQQ